MLAVVYLLVAGALYGLLFSIHKVATTNEVPGIGYVFWHTLGAGLILLPVCMVARTPVGFSAVHLRFYTICGAIGISIPVSILAHVAPKLPASLVVMVTCLSPTCTYLIAMTIRMERFRLLSTVGVGLGLVGVVILVLPGITVPTFAEASWLLLHCSRRSATPRSTSWARSSGRRRRTRSRWPAVSSSAVPPCWFR